jgi:hypothetical protein
MTASLAKKVRELEAAFWSQAEYIKMPDDEALDILISLHPLEIPVFNSWYAGDIQAQKIARRVECIEKTLPPIHPAFLRSKPEAIRGLQWGLHLRADYRELAEDFWT